MAQYVPELGDEPLNIREMLDDDPPPPAWVPHLVLRGTYLPGTVRCTAGDLFRPPSYLQDEFGDTTEERSIKCYIDVRANVYVLGNGPSTLTTLLFVYSYCDHQYTSYLEEGQTEQDLVEEFRQQVETAIDDVFPSREHIMFLGPAVDLSSEAWRFMGYWDVQRQEDGTVVAVHPDRDLWRRRQPDDYQTYRSVLEMELPAFKQAVTEANQARVTQYEGRIGADEGLPMLVSDANQLRQYFIAVGAYDHPDGPPAQPPPPCGLAVPDQADNPGLMKDCMTLLAAKDTLRGTAALNWSVDTAITGWEGVTTGGTPSQVTKVELPNEGLSGSIPAQLWELAGLTHLDLADNSLAGEIPREFRWLPKLEEIRLSGNSLTGCIPIALEDVATNDLSSLNIPYCQPPAPENFRAGEPSEASVPLSWDAVPNTSKYRVEHWPSGDQDWTVIDDTITTTTHTADGLACGTEHYFQVSAYGDGTIYATEWSEPSAIILVTTAECTPPVFGASSYAFTIAGDAEVGAIVGSVAATDSTGDTVSHAITEGNDAGAFAIDETTGEITVAGPLDYETTPSYTLTVTASNTVGTAMADAAISITADYDGDAVT